MATVGELTASIAHEITQPMSSILANAGAGRMMLEKGTLEPDKLREILQDIESEDLRASHIIEGIRKLLARRENKHDVLDVNAEAGAALEHVSHESQKRGIRLVRRFGHVRNVLGEAVQLQQVVINLAMNAIDAVTPEGGGALREITFETRDGNDGVEIVVSDTGPGVAPEHEPQLFGAMFTTKDHGMGFGLSIVRTSVEAHGGRISYERNKPRGAVFRVWLPATTEAFAA